MLTLPSRRFLLGGAPLPLLDLDFCRQVYSSLGASVSGSLITLTRTNPPDVYTLNRAGSPIGPFGADTLRLSDRGVSVWTNHSQLFRSSSAPATQTRTVSSGTTYTVTYWGSGSVVLAGATVATLTPGVPYIFVAATTSLVFTVSGSVSFVNCEVANYGQPPIIAGSGGSVTSGSEWNQLDLANFAWQSGLRQFSVLCAFEAYASDAVSGTMYEIEGGGCRLTSNFIAASQMGTSISDGTTTTGYDPPVPNIVQKGILQVYGMSIDLDAKRITVCVLDSMEGESALSTSSFAQMISGLRYLHVGCRASATALNGWVRGLRITQGYSPGGLIGAVGTMYAHYA